MSAEREISCPPTWRSRWPLTWKAEPPGRQSRWVHATRWLRRGDLASLLVGRSGTVWSSGSHDMTQCCLAGANADSDLARLQVHHEREDGQRQADRHDA